jgi:hypothetical protein
MKIVNQNIFTSKYDILLVAGNSFVTQAGRLVMGAGSALQLRNMFNDIDKELGYYVLSVYGHLGKYGVLFSGRYVKDKFYGVFQTKTDFKLPSDWKLIAYSAEILQEQIDIYRITYEKEPEISLVFPGVGKGKLSVKDIYPIISHLPECVTIYCDDKTWNELKKEGLV